jgi:hypothetical protein
MLENILDKEEELVRLINEYNELEDSTDFPAHLDLNILIDEKIESIIKVADWCDRLYATYGGVFNLKNSLHFSFWLDDLSVFGSKKIMSWLEEHLQNYIDDKIVIGKSKLDASKFFKTNKFYKEMKPIKIEVFNQLIEEVNKNPKINLIDWKNKFRAFSKSEIINHDTCIWINDYNTLSYQKSHLDSIFIAEEDEVVEIKTYHGVGTYNLHDINTELAQLSDRINKNIVKLQKQALKDRFYFCDAPFAVYKETFSERQIIYLENNIDAEEVDFIKNEFRILYNKRFLTYDDEVFNYKDIIYSDSPTKYSKRKKISYVNEKLEAIGIKAYCNYDTSIHAYLIQFDDITIESDNENTTNSNNENDESYDTKVFVSYASYDYFKRGMQYLNATNKQNKKLRGFLAKANAVFRNGYIKDNIFKPALSLKDYIHFLTVEYDFEHTTKLSNPNTYETSVKRFIADFPYSEEDEHDE